MDQSEKIKKKYCLIKSHLNEKGRRLWAAAEAMVFGRGGIKVVCQATEISGPTIRSGIIELKLNITEQTSHKKSRKLGGGRKSATKKYPDLKKDLLELLESATRGDPMSPLLWSAKSTRNLAIELQKKGYTISHVVVAKLLSELEYSLQANKKTQEGSKNPDRNAQFEHINDKAKAFLKNENPVISIDTKKKELVGNFKNAGQEYAPKGEAEEVNVYDFQNDLLKAIPYGIYDIVKNEGWVNVGITNDTSAFAVQSIRKWWNGLGKTRYPSSTKLMITADGGGSNGSRRRLFKTELQKFSNETGLEISVCHFPPGTSKWNKIEHRLFSFISQNWRAKPLIDLVTVVNLIAATTTKTGLKVCCELDENVYKKGIVVSDEEMNNLNIKKDDFHGEWNYTISPQK
jgi:transposase